MSLFITSLASGSNGNCYYVGNDNEAILIDAGVSCKEIEKRLYRLALSIQKIKAIFISHEHADHIKGLPVFAKKYNLTIYITTATLANCKLHVDKKLVKSFSAHEPILIGGLMVTAFPKFHDAIDPYSFVVSCNSLKVGVFTDIGHPCQQVIAHFSQCHAAFLEANYDDEMLDTGSYPYYLKNRIRGERGHLSNKQALDLFKDHKPSFMSHLFLSHLSKNNNCSKLVQQLFDQHSSNIKIIVASRFEETPVFQISESIINETLVKHPSKTYQLSLSF